MTQMAEGKHFEDLFERYLDGRATTAERLELMEKIEESEENEAFENISQRRWESASDATDNVPGRMMFDSIRHAVSPQPAVADPRPGSGAKQTKKILSRRWISVAAAVLIVAAAGFAGYFISDIKPFRTAPQPFTISVGCGQKASITLPDGTLVWINSNSSVSYDASYNRRVRNVELEGEAFFEVARNPDKPFCVTTQGLEVEVLGTEFNVKSYPDDDLITTGVREGHVVVRYGQREMELARLQMSSYRKSDGRFLRSDIADMAAVDYWRSDILVFDATALGEIAKTIERMYGINVLFQNDALRKICFSGTINNSSVVNIFDMISLSYPISYRIDGDTITISDKKRP